MSKLKVYLDNCCYNRPFDDLSQEKVVKEASAKVYIQLLIKFNCLYLSSSFMSIYEISQSPFKKFKEHILHFINEHTSFFISEDKECER
jgi:hypothetical protein